MKKIVLFSLSFLLACVASNATIHMVDVANYQFTPANISNVFVGDTIRWTRTSGTHTTTCDPASDPNTSLPSGAPIWDAQVNSGTPIFDYVVSVAGAYTYVCLYHSNMVGTFTASAVMPVKLTSLLVSGSGNSATLKWGTETEQNTEYFSVRRSANGSEFQEIAKLPAAGSSNTLKSYSFTDTKISSKQRYYYYNIAVVDKDGKNTYSENKLYKNNDATVKLLSSVGPNPLNRSGNLLLSFNAESEGQMNIRVVNNEGEIVLNTKMQAHPGANNQYVHFDNLPSGAYNLICTMNGVTETQKILYK